MTDVSDPGGFYHLANVPLEGHACQGTACFVARRRDPAGWAAAEQSSPRVYCLGKCYAAPATAATSAVPRVEAAVSTPIVLERLADGGAPGLGAYEALGGYTALHRALTMAPEEMVSEVERSGLRGRGGAAFSTGRKWRALLARGPGPVVVVANADEGDPGAYIDRVILEDDPHCVLEAMAIAAVTFGARQGYVYVRAEYPEAAAAMRRAVDEATAAGVLGERVLGNPRPFRVEVVEGHGSYLCGEETALLNALEYRRPFVRARPPYPVEHGLFGAPTLVQNVETLASIPWIVRHGGDAYARLGTGTSRGTKVVSLNSLFAEPGLYEVELGVPVRHVVEHLGGGLVSGSLRGVLIGGPLAGILPPHLLDAPLAFDELDALGAAVGHGGVVAFDEHTSIAELVHHVFRFGAFESCGECTPCRVGAGRVEELFADASAGRRRAPDERSEWHEIVAALGGTSLCGHGIGLADFARSVLKHYPEEVDSCFA